MPKYIILNCYMIKETKYLIEYKYKTAAVKNDGRKRYGKKETKSPL